MIRALGYPGITIAVAIESVVVPIPSEVIIPLGGFLTAGAGAKLNLVGVMAAATLGGMLGSWFIYGVSYWGREAVVLRLIRRWGRWVAISERDFDRATAAFAKRGEVIVLVGRMIPGLRSLISIPAGLARMSFWRFALYTGLGTLIWSGALAWVGALLGERWDTIQASPVFEIGKVGVLVLLAAGILYYAWGVVRRRRTYRRSTSATSDPSAAADPPSPAPSTTSRPRKS